MKRRQRKKPGREWPAGDITEIAVFGSGFRDTWHKFKATMYERKLCG